MLATPFLLTSLVFAVGERRPVAMVVHVVGDVEVQSVQGKAQSAKAMRSLYPDDRLSAAEKAEITVVFLDGVRELLKGKGQATVRTSGCDPKSAVVRIPVPKKPPGSNVPDSKLGPRGAGLSIALKQLDANMAGFVGECLAAGAIQPSVHRDTGEIFFSVADEAKLNQIRSEYPRFPAELRDALFAQARASQAEGFALYLLRKQSSEDKRAHIYAHVLSADMAKRKRQLETARQDYKIAVEALGREEALAVLGREAMDWYEKVDLVNSPLLAGPAKYFVEASSRLISLAGKGGREGYALRGNLSSFGGGWLKQSRTEWEPVMTVELTAGKSIVSLAPAIRMQRT